MHPNVIDLTGRKFGKWTVIRRGENAKGRQARWYCRCECGRETLVLGYQLRTHKGYGCKFCARWKGCGELSYSYYQQIQNGAKQRKMKFSLSIDDMWNLFLKQKRRCALSNEKLYMRVNYKSEQTASLDRINSLKGYVKHNVQWVHKDINKMKANLSEDRFIELCKMVNNHVL